MNSPEAGEPIGESETLRGLSAGQRVCGRYTLQRVLGRGGMGVVWLALDGELDQHVALKFLPDLFALDRVALDELRRETRRSRALTHPHMVRVHDFVRDERTAAIVMEYVDGDTLAHLRLAQPGQIFEPAQLSAWVEQLASALDYAHGKAKIVHRDLKPANLMIDARGDLKIADFGISATVSETVTRVSQVASSSGTPVYMSPQQMRGLAPTPADDIYAIGTTLHELLTGRPPFFRGDIQWQVVSEVPGSIAKRRVELGVTGDPIPAQWETVIAACLAKEPDGRPATAGEVAARLAGSAATTAAAVRPEQPDGEAVTVVHKPAWVQPAAAASTPVRPEVESVATQKLSHPQADVGRASRPGRKLRVAFWAVVAGLLAVAGGVTWRYAMRGPHGGENVVSPAVPGTAMPAAPNAATPSAASSPAATQAAVVRPAVVPAAQVPRTPRPPQPGQPWENKLGMKFVPVPGTDVLFCIWETRGQDFEAFVKDSGHDATGGMRSNRGAGWEVGYDTWKSPGFPQGPTHPVVGVSWDDAKGFCQWLSKREQLDGWLKENQWYRLPRDWEWSVAVGLEEDRLASPDDKDGKIKGVFPWGTGYPPPQGISGNYADEAARRGRFSQWETIFGYEDGYETTAPVGSYPANRFGIFDLGGNVDEWVEDNGGGSWTRRTIRGSSFLDSGDVSLASSYRGFNEPTARLDVRGFRVVCVAAPSESEVSPWGETFAPDGTRREDVTVTADPVATQEPQPGQSWRIPGLDVEMIWVEPGSFTMGSPDGEKDRNEDEGPQTRVTLTEGFWLGACELTQGQAVALMGSNPSTMKKAGGTAPVETITWNDAVALCQKLTEREQRAGRLPLGYVYTLPTEAQWEYACRAGTSEAYGGTGNADEMAWTWENSGDTTHAVGSRAPNAWAFHDMHGNVWEWCADCYVDRLPGGSVSDPRGPSSGKERVFRGGCYANPADASRSARRAREEPEIRYGGVGIRLALAPEPGAVPDASSR